LKAWVASAFIIANSKGGSKFGLLSINVTLKQRISWSNMMRYYFVDH